jgi:hypothetical protein
MDDTLKQLLLREADCFRDWASRAWANRDAEPLSAEWETEYEEWSAIYDAFTRYVQGCPHGHWDDEVKVTLLYLIARDNESEFLLDVLAQDVDAFLALAGDAVASEERDAVGSLPNGSGTFTNERQRPKRCSHSLSRTVTRSSAALRCSRWAGLGLSRSRGLPKSPGGLGTSTSG